MTSTIDGQDFRISLDAANGAPIYRQIIQQVEYAVLSGRAREGDRLPTIRSLAVDLKINPNTIARAYSELEIRGIVETRAGCGTYIAAPDHPPEDDGRARKIAEVFSRFTQEMADLGVSKQELITMLEAEGSPALP
jgi:GntR family transcriptional regulator